MAHDYEVAIHLTVSGNAAAGLTGVSRQMAEINAGAKNLQKTFGLLFAGGMMERFGKETLGAIGKILNAAGNFQKVQNQMTAMGMTQKEIAESVSKSWGLAKDNIHISVQEIAQMNRHAVEIFGSAQAAAEHMPEMAKLAEFQARWGAGKTGLKQVDVSMAIRDMAKTTEGAAMLQKDPKVFDKFADNLMKSLISAGGNVSATQYLQAQRHARAAAFGWDDSFRFGVFPAMVQEYGPGAGVMSQQAFTKLGAGAQWTKTGIAQGVEMGLIDPKKVEYDKVGRPMRMLPGGSKYASEFIEDPLKYVEKYVTPWLDKNTKNIGERAGILTRLMGRGTAASSLIAYDTQAFKYEKDRALWGKARMDIPDGWSEAMVAFEEKWKDLMVALGTPSLASATSALGAMTKAIISLTGTINDHPDAARNLLAITAGLAAALTALGAFTVAAGIVGLLEGGVIVVGITALTGGLAGLAAVHWDVITSGFKQFLDSLRNTNWNEEITKALMPAIIAIKAWFSNLGAAIMESLKGMWENMKGALGNLFHINYEGGGFGGGGSSAGALSAGERGQYAGIIKKVAMQEGVDPNSLLKIYGTEGASAWYGDGGKSYGPFQLYTGGGLGNIYHGSRERSAKGVEEQTRFVARWGKSHGGWSSDIWHGLRGHGGSIPMRSAPKGQTAENHHHHIYLDGTKIATYVSKKFARAAQYPTSVGRQDGRGTFMGPGAEVFA